MLLKYVEVMLTISCHLLVYLHDFQQCHRTEHELYQTQFLFLQLFSNIVFSKSGTGGPRWCYTVWWRT